MILHCSGPGEVVVGAVVVGRREGIRVEALKDRELGIGNRKSGSLGKSGPGFLRLRRTMVVCEMLNHLKKDQRVERNWRGILGGILNWC